MNKSEEKQLILRGHSLKPTVLIGNKGLTDSVIAELNVALTDHELIKIKLGSTDRVLRQTLIASACEKTNALLISSIGRTAVLYREREQS